MKYVRVIRYEIEVDDETLEELEQEHEILRYYGEFNDEDLDYEGGIRDVLDEHLED